MTSQEQPHPEKNPNLDEATRTLLRVISLEEQIKKLENDCWKGLATMKEFQELDKRVKELEVARSAQRQLNASFAVKEPVKEPVSKKSSSWRLW